MDNRFKKTGFAHKVVLSLILVQSKSG